MKKVYLLSMSIFFTGCASDMAKDTVVQKAQLGTLESQIELVHYYEENHPDSKELHTARKKLKDTLSYGEPSDYLNLFNEVNLPLSYEDISDAYGTYSWHARNKTNHFSNPNKVYIKANEQMILVALRNNDYKTAINLFSAKNVSSPKVALSLLDPKVIDWYINNYETILDSEGMVSNGYRDTHKKGIRPIGNFLEDMDEILVKSSRVNTPDVNKMRLKLSELYINNDIVMHAFYDPAYLKERGLAFLDDYIESVLPSVQNISQSHLDLLTKEYSNNAAKTFKYMLISYNKGYSSAKYNLDQIPELSNANIGFKVKNYTSVMGRPITKISPKDHILVENVILNNTCDYFDGNDLTVFKGQELVIDWHKCINNPKSIKIYTSHHGAYNLTFE
ncbi:hypothetical protein ACP3V5_14830 [Vibrio maritimus]